MFTEAKKYDGAKVPIHFRPWNESSLERKFSGTSSQERMFSLLGTFAPGSESTEERKGHNSHGRPFPVRSWTAVATNTH